MRKGLASAGQTRDLLSAHGAGKGDRARPLSVPREKFCKNFDAINWDHRPRASRRFHKNYGSPVGPRTRRYLPDKVKVQKGVAAQRKWQAEYDSISRECAVQNAELRADGYDTCGN